MKTVAIIFTVMACGGSQKPPVTTTAPEPVAAEPSPEAKAHAEAATAIKAADEAKARVDELANMLDKLNRNVDEAVTQTMNAHTDAERAAATTTLEKLRSQKTAIEREVMSAKEAAAKAERAKGVHVSKECIDNPLAKGCS
ncbi:MAG TPA: hypothetical protein VGO00_21555 [Kofleriaceae bacterium]|nr:hypothetical protein [Kofleriaceae bacterium]